jgi:hypothetical protein
VDFVPASVSAVAQALARPATSSRGRRRLSVLNEPVGASTMLEPGAEVGAGRYVAPQNRLESVDNAQSPEPGTRDACSYNYPVADEHERRAVLSGDTDATAEALQVRAWQAMAPDDIARLVDDLSSLARQLALAGLRQRYPDASDVELVARLAVTTLGPELAHRIYPLLTDRA